MVLNENTQNMINETYDSFGDATHKVMEKEVLQEWTEGDTLGASDINEAHLDEATKMAMLQEKYINETNFSDNIATFTPKLQPLLRRIIPKLMAFEIAGVQPVPTPTADIFMLKAQYAGTSTLSADKDTSVIVEMAQGTTAQPVAKGDTLTSDTGAAGTVVYVEADLSKAIVNVIAGTFVAGGLMDVGAAYSADANDITVVNVYSNEAAFKQILPGYSGTYSTADAERLGEEMNQLRVTIVSQGITVKSRKLKAELTIELIKDMQTQHGVSAEKEIMFFLETEIVNDMNMEIINKYKEIAVNEPNFAVKAGTYSRHAKEAYSGLYDRILKDKINVADRNRRGSANILLATAGVIAALMSLEKFQDLASASSVKTGENHSQNYVGTLKDGTKVYQDWFATSEYYMCIYKGQGNFDNGIIYAPYAPLELLTATDPKTLQPIMGMSVRSCLVSNSLLDNGVASDYCSIRFIDMTDLPIEG